jgi:hypothetical protein
MASLPLEMATDAIQQAFNYFLLVRAEPLNARYLFIPSS